MLGSGAKTQNLTMKKKRHTTEEIIRILRKADGEQTVEEVCREFNISELKKMLADALLKNRVLEETLSKKW